MRSSLRRGARGKIPLALRFLFGRDLSRRLGGRFLFHNRVHLGFRRWWRCFLVSLSSASHNLTVHELVAINMRPDAAVIRPSGGSCRDRLHFRSRVRGFLFLRRRIGLCSGRGETGQKGQRQNGSYHIFVFGLQFRSGRIPGAKVAGQRPSESAQTVRDSRQKGNSNANLFFTVPSTGWVEKNVRGPALPRCAQSRSPENQPRNKIRRRNASSAPLDRRFPAAYPCARHDSQRRRVSLQLSRFFGVFPLNACQIALFASRRP